MHWVIMDYGYIERVQAHRLRQVHLRPIRRRHRRPHQSLRMLPPKRLHSLRS